MTMRFDEKTFVPTITTNWSRVCRIKFLSEEFIMKWKDCVDWKELCLHQKLSRSFLFERIRKYDANIAFGQLQKNMFLSKALKKDLEMWGNVKMKHHDDFYDFLDKIEDRMYGAV